MNQLFYCPDIQDGFARLDEEESRHLLVVLRRQAGDRLQLTDGKGFFYEAEIAETGKKSALARILERRPTPLPPPALHVAIAPTKQIERFEWFLEKAVEIGVGTVTPLLCRRSERRQIRHDRLEKILLSAMKQSLRATLPQLRPLTEFDALVQNAAEATRCIAWCDDRQNYPHLRELLRPDTPAIVLIGPEGDFMPEEVSLARAHGFAPVSLGPARLRTETAGVFAAAMCAG